MIGFEMLSNRSQWITFQSKGRLNQGLGTENVLKLESQMPMANQAKKQFDDHPYHKSNYSYTTIQSLATTYHLPVKQPLTKSKHLYGDVNFQLLQQKHQSNR